jgi:hypothetical protein|tara:strand:- start:222 stop:497 length:276 start_codon:yes stop_codon:yes gene_type:complete
MEMILSIILSIIVITSFFIIRNLMTKNENQEDIIKEYEDFIIKQSDAINKCGERLTHVDNKGIFYADDEIGWFFKEIQKIQESLNEFTLLK